MNNITTNKIQQMIKVLTSAPASGKTEYCIARIREVSEQKNPVNIWVLVPDGYQASQFRQRLARSGGSMGVSINSFGSLPRSILEQNHIYIPMAPKAVVQQLVRKSIEAVDLQYYFDIASMPGFTEVLIERFGELKRGLVSPETLIKSAANKTIKVQEIASN